MASPDELAAIFASAWAAGAGSRPSMAQTAQLAALWKDAKRAQPDLDERDFAIALAGLAPGPEGLAAYLGAKHGSQVALEATMARGTVGSVAPPAFAATVASGPLGAVPPAATDGKPTYVPGRYRILRKLGAGAMGVVWEAEDKQLHRKVALKWVTPAAAGDKGYRSRLLREARALAQIHHPNVMAVYDVGEAGDELYLALELIDGTTAREATPSLAIWRQAGAGLAAVHAAGIVHRDVKPENVFVARDGRVVIGDFGLATGDLGETIMASNLTATGAVVGTPLYMPPEQLHGDPATAKGDQFSLCVCAWEAITGKRPFDSTTIAGLAVAMLKAPPVPAGVDRRLVAALQRGLAPEPEQRWPDIPALLAALEPAPAKRRGGMIAVIAAVAVGAAGAVTLMQLARSTPTAVPSPPPTATSGGDPSAPPVPNAASSPPGANPPAAAPSAKPPTVTPGAGKLVAAASGTPSPVVPAAPPSSGTPHWRQEYDDSINALAAHDGKRCLALLKDMDTWPPDASRELDMSKSMVSSCMMAAGDCAGGRAAVASYGKSHGYDQARIDKSIVDKDAKWCALDAEPKSAWPKRVAKRIAEHLTYRASCKVELDFIAANHLVPEPPIPGNQMMSCLVADHRCEEARTAYFDYVRNGGPPLSPQMKQTAESSFDQINPTCRDP